MQASIYQQERQARRLHWGLWLLMAINLCMGLLLITLRYEARKDYTELAEAMRVHDELQAEWTQLLLEQSVYASETRIEQLAREKLNMQTVQADDMRIIVRE